MNDFKNCVTALNTAHSTPARKRNTLLQLYSTSTSSVPIPTNVHGSDKITSIWPTKEAVKISEKENSRCDLTEQTRL